MATTNIFTEAWAKIVLDAITQNTAYANGLRGAGSPPLYLALLINNNATTATVGTFPTEDNTTALLEFTSYTTGGNSTNRPTVTFGTVSAAGGAASAQSSKNTGAVTYNITGTGVITGIAVCTLATKGNGTAGNNLVTTVSGGNVIWYGEVAANISVVNGNTLTFNTDQITISLG